MIRAIYAEILAIAADMFEAADFMADIIDGDACGEIKNDSARRDLELVRARFRSHASALRAFSAKLEAEAAK